MVLDVGRIKHRADLMHRSVGSNAAAIPSNWVLSADGLKNVVWTPRDAAGGGSVSYGSNANDISVAGQAGASSLVSRADHVHRGVRSVSHSSNTLFGNITLLAGNGIGITSPTPGTLTITGTPGPAGPPGSGGGGGFTHAYLGYNTVGGSTETMTNAKVYFKQITVASAGILTAISCHVDAGAGNDSVASLSSAVYSDNAGDPQYLIGYSVGRTDSLLLDTTSGAGGNTNARWFHMPSGIYVPAATYWIAVAVQDNDAPFRIYFDATGTDRTTASGSNWFADWGFYSPTTTANQYSIRASIIS